MFCIDCASKFAVRGLTQTAGQWSLRVFLGCQIEVILALELGEHGITVNAYAPGLIKTQLSKCCSSLTP
jgi:NAD(P)-dependent dehydrogenase (short-subunit alcohol dehydrogenase family)